MAQHRGGRDPAPEPGRLAHRLGAGALAPWRCWENALEKSLLDPQDLHESCWKNVR